ncbi:MAG: bifunctional folylpolyglutamate synthase/dihydrofolate synthase [Desulfitobacteriaceae bacterium]|nr:bifunctional folylpolyglutamate synthase/dihydrofolate synthase [Desulfitobacteriaceae bacterium]MDD4345727.1 bifunctional folylpolyglutamate synthase/dihydrofolate synthase [Desulfitobacteriaceae bacterium]MDD4400415.1 bifunctional folylpolyglutamate synthase/dihydrofolate synthase [Desulfitobacteriaceae bacterium]
MDKPGEDQLYIETLNYLAGLTKFGMNLGLARIRALLEYLNNPERQLRIIHVGGTNGKGSTSIMIAQILWEAGYKTGIFTSPHLHDYRERFVINGKMISKSEVIRQIKQLRPHLEELVAGGREHPTEFEVQTALAMNYFAQEKVDFAIIEVGLGGEIDSTNVGFPLVSVITNVGMDHLNYLGEDLTAIAEVKAGIIKPNSVVVTAADRPQVMDIIAEKAAGFGVKLVRVGEDVFWKKQRSGEFELKFDLVVLNTFYPGLRLNLMGEHQLRNAATAVAVCEVLKTDYAVAIPGKAVYEALAKVKWPGRLELLSSSPKVLLDGAHNVDGAEVLLQALKEYSRDRLILCIGMLDDKEREKIADLLIPIADEVFITKPQSLRAGDWIGLADIAGKYSKPVTCIDNPREAVKEAFRRLKSTDLLCVTGSLYLLADAREELLKILKIPSSFLFG